MRRLRHALGIAAFAAASSFAMTVAVAASGDGQRARASVLSRGAGGHPALLTRWVSLRPAPLARTEVAAAQVAGSIYVAGGFVPSGNVATAVVERYDVAANHWTRVRSMPLTLNHAAATAYRGALYVLGGYTGSTGLSGETNALLRYDPARNSWTRLPPAPTPRAALAVGVLGGRLYAAGGARRGVPLRTLEVFDFATRRWSTGPPMRVAREHVGGVATAGGLYVAGGRREGLNNLSVVERYVPSLHRWQRLASLRTPRSGIAAVAVGQGVAVFGGERRGATIAAVELYDPHLGRWLARPALRTPRHGLGGASLGRRIFAAEGGVEPGFSFSRVLEALDVP